MNKEWAHCPYLQLQLASSISSSESMMLSEGREKVRGEERERRGREEERERRGEREESKRRVRGE